jgi:xylulokinase
MTQVTVGIDIGTTSVKAVAADEDGNVVARTRIPHRLLVPSASRMEHDAEEAWRQGPLQAWDELSHTTHDAHDIAAVAVSAMVPSMTAVDAGGHPIGPGLLYGDDRGRPATPEKLREDNLPIGEVIEFLRWTAAQHPTASGFWAAPAVANHALGGEAVVDLGVAFTSIPLFDGTKWDEAVCADCGVNPEQLPRVEQTGTAVGYVTAAGTGTDTVLATGGVDALCEQMVAGVENDGDVLVLCGTTLIVWITVPDWHQAKGLWTVPHTAPGKFQVGGASNAGGLFLGWADRLLAPADPDTAHPDHVPVWLPYVRGERTPWHDPDRRATIDNLDLTHDAAALRRAAFEASGFVVRHILELAGVQPRRIVATGGGTRVSGWLQAIADATGEPVDVAGVPDGAALGAAFLARTAVDLEQSVTEASRWARTDHVVEPRDPWHKAMDERYHRFRALAENPPIS